MEKCINFFRSICHLPTKKCLERKGFFCLKFQLISKQFVTDKHKNLIIKRDLDEPSFFLGETSVFEATDSGFTVAVKLVSQTSMNDGWIERAFEVEETRFDGTPTLINVTQFHFTDWPDRGEHRCISSLFPFITFFVLVLLISFLALIFLLFFIIIADAMAMKVFAF
jgi:hypothetical protein